jgi:hypothetical protein
MNSTPLNCSLLEPYDYDMFLANDTNMMDYSHTPFLSSKGDSFLMNRINLSMFTFPGAYQHKNDRR